MADSNARRVTNQPHGWTILVGSLLLTEVGQCGNRREFTRITCAGGGIR
jgi:hypothetical protein